MIRLAHTADLEPALLAEAHAMLVEVFEGDFEDHDWEHALGGIHALALSDDGELVGHASVIQRRLLHGERALRTGYVEAVGVRREARRHGHASALMDAIERVIRGAYELGALGASDMAIPFYAGRGWLPWQGETYALTPQGRVRTPEDDDSLYVLEVSAAPLDRTGQIACDWRDGAVWQRVHSPVTRGGAPAANLRATMTAAHDKRILFASIQSPGYVLAIQGPWRKQR